MVILFEKRAKLRKELTRFLVERYLMIMVTGKILVKKVDQIAANI